MAKRVSFKSLLASVMPLALLGAGEDAESLFLLQQADVALRAADENVKARARNAYLADPEKFKAKAREQRKTRRQRTRELTPYIKMKRREYASTRAATGKAAEYREATRQEHRAWAKEQSQAATELYARSLLAKGSPLRGKDFPPKLVQIKQIEIQLRRALK